MSECPTCGDSFKSERGMKSHHYQIHNKSITNYEQTCEQCGETFEYESERPYCSIECSAKSQEDKVSKTCKFCGDCYTVPSCRQNSSNYCSYECNNRAKADYIEIECKECGNNFTLPKWKIDTYKTKYCSDKCARQAQKNGSIKSCKVCEDLFYVPRHREDSAKFCDIYCKKEYETANYDRGKKSGEWSTFSTKYRNWVGECESCGASPEHLHHDEPIFKGGDLWDNTFTVLCTDCHLGDYKKWH